MKIKTHTLKTDKTTWKDFVDTQYNVLQLAIKDQSKRFCPDVRMNHSLNMIRNPYYAIAFNKAVEFNRYIDRLKLEHGKWN